MNPTVGSGEVVFAGAGRPPCALSINSSLPQRCIGFYHSIIRSNLLALALGASEDLDVTYRGSIRNKRIQICVMRLETYAEQR